MSDSPKTNDQQSASGNGCTHRVEEKARVKPPGTFSSALQRILGRKTTEPTPELNDVAVSPQQLDVPFSARPPATGFETLQRVLGYSFRDLDFLRRALTHPSYVNEHPEDETGDNQRLEFLGDAVVDFVAGAWVYRNYPDFDEGRMTRLRAALVRTEALAQLARQVSIGRALRLGRGEEESGGRERDANLCDAFEAVVGALYLDGGLEAARAFVEPFVGPMAEATLAAEADRDAKSRLQEWSQAELGVTPRYRIVAEEGPDHAKTFVAQVLLVKEVAGQGEGRSKQAAEQSAAQAAWESLMQR
jgi:ribonuclease-3